VRKIESTQASHHRFAETVRHSLRDGFTVSFALSSVIGRFVTVVGAMRKHCRQLNVSVETSGPHDFAVRPKPRSSVAAKASIASRAQRS
jgi:hypothetical protein